MRQLTGGSRATRPSSRWFGRRASSAWKRIKKAKIFTLAAIAGAVEQLTGVANDDLRSASKQAPVMTGRRLLSVVSKKYGYKGKEIAEYLRKDPAAVAGYLRNAAEEWKMSAMVETALEKKSKDKSQ